MGAPQGDLTPAPTQRSVDAQSETTQDTRNLLLNTPDTVKRDQFELISAYLDSEVTVAERRQVEMWLDHDPIAQRLYRRLLRLRQGVQSLPIPDSPQPAPQVAEQLFARLNQQLRHRLALGGAAIAAVLVATVSGLPSLWSPAPQVADQPLERTGSASHKLPGDSLMIALDRPVVEIPKAPVSLPEQTLRQSQSSSANN